MSGRPRPALTGTDDRMLTAYVSHLVNPRPMALLWPVVPRRVRPRWLPAVRENSLGGRCVELAVVIGIVATAVPRVLSTLQ